MWVSSQRFTELEKKVNKLDPENVLGRLQAALEEVSRFEKDTKQELINILDEKTKEQDKRVEEFISLTQKTTTKVLSRISDLVEEISALVGEKPSIGAVKMGPRVEVIRKPGETKEGAKGAK